MPFTHVSLEFDGCDCATTKLMYIPERHFSFCRLCRFKRTCSAMAGYGTHDRPPKRHRADDKWWSMFKRMRKWWNAHGARYPSFPLRDAVLICVDWTSKPALNVHEQLKENKIPSHAQLAIHRSLLAYWFAYIFSHDLKYQYARGEYWRFELLEF